MYLLQNDFKYVVHSYFFSGLKLSKKIWLRLQKRCLRERDVLKESFSRENSTDWPYGKWPLKPKVEVNWPILKFAAAREFSLLHGCKFFGRKSHITRYSKSRNKKVEKESLSGKIRPVTIWKMTIKDKGIGFKTHLRNYRSSGTFPCAHLPIFQPKVSFFVILVIDEH